MSALLVVFALNILFITTIIAFVGGKFVFFIFSAIATFDYYLRINHLTLDLGVLGSIVDSNLNEAVEYFLFIKASVYVKLVIFFILYYLSVNITKDKIRKTFPTAMLVVFSSVLIIKLYNLPSNEQYTYINKDYLKTKHHEVWFRFLGFIMITRPLSTYYELSLLSRDTVVVSNWTNVRTIEDQKDIYVINIGESVAKKYYPYYSVNHTSDLNSVKIYDGVIAPSVVTRFSVPRILSKNVDVYRYDENLNIIDLANDAGMKTYWISNQAKVGQHETQISAIANKAEYQYYQNTSYEKARPDNVLFPEIVDVISESSNRSKVIFIHTMGSHHDFCKRVDRDVSQVFSEDNYLMCYKESVAYGVDFVKRIRDLLVKNGKTYKLIYFSDHGLTSVNSPPYLVHGVGSYFSKQALEVPFITMSDDTVKTEKYMVKYSLRDFSDTFAQWAGIYSEQTDLSKSIFNVNYTNHHYDSVLTSEFKAKKIN